MSLRETFAGIQTYKILETSDNTYLNAVYILPCV